MNKVLIARFQAHHTLLIESASVTRFVVLKQKIAKSDGRIRIRAKLVDGGLLEFAEYIELDNDDQIVDHVYSFHWQDEQNQLVLRWDNVNHYPKLPFAPHHIHLADGTVKENPKTPTLTFVLREIERKTV
jgi:hypothetical protein